MQELATIPERITRTFESAHDIEDRVARYRFMQECFVLARGVNYAVSLEAALKIQETTFVRAKAFARTSSAETESRAGGAGVGRNRPHIPHIEIVNRTEFPPRRKSASSRVCVG